MKGNIKKTKNRFISMLGTVFVFVSCLLVPVSASNVITDSALSFNMAFIGSSGTGLGYYSSGYRPISGNETYALSSDLSSGSFNSSSFISSVVNVKKTDDSFLFLAGEIVNYTFNKFSFSIQIPFDNTYECEFFKDVRIDVIYDDDSTQRIYPNYDFDGTGSYVLTGSFTAERNVKEVKLDFIFSPYTALNFNGSYDYYYFMFCPPTVLFDVISRDSQVLGNIDNNLNNAINGTPEQNQQAQDAVGGLNNSTDKLDSLGDTMSNVEKPSIDSNKISADSLVPHTSLVVLSSPFQALWENNQLLAMLTIVVTLVLVSWVFFGKKA